MGRKDKLVSVGDNIYSIGVVLRQARQEKGLSLTSMAALVDYSKSYLSGAENGTRPASPGLIQRYENVLGIPSGDLKRRLETLTSRGPVQLDHNMAGSWPIHWYVPYQRNSFFTGREEILTNLHISLRQKQGVGVQIRSLSGLGGIGKTQVAIEYAYRYRGVYNIVFWVRAETKEVLITDFASLAHILGIPDLDAQDQISSSKAALKWLQNHEEWLLILDNVENLEIVKDFIPLTAKDGYVLFTSRNHSVGTIAEVVPIERMSRTEGTLFLLRRASFITSSKLLEDATTENVDLAHKITMMLDGLPLALDQAGAYIEETGCGLSRYLALYEIQAVRLLKRRGNYTIDHPEPIMTTLLLSLEKVHRANPAALELLQLSAFLYPDTIPEEMIIEGASDLSTVLQAIVVDPIAWDECIGVLLTYSLLHRDFHTHVLSFHRLVQTIVKNEMSNDIRIIWIERAVRIVNRLFPSVNTVTIPHLQRYLQQAFTCTKYMEDIPLYILEAAQLLNKIGAYQIEHAQYSEAEEFIMQALTICEKVQGGDSVDAIQILSNLVNLYRIQGKYEQAEPLAQRALTMSEQILGYEHRETIRCLSYLVDLYRAQGKYEQADQFTHRLLAMVEMLEEISTFDISDCLNDLAKLYYNRAEYTSAEKLHLRALSLRESKLGAEHPKTAESLIGLAVIYHAQEHFDQAEVLYRRALVIDEKVLGPDHPNTLNCLDGLARLYHTQYLYEQVEILYQRLLQGREKLLGPEHPYVAISLHHLASLYSEQQKYQQAEVLFSRALMILEKAHGDEHSDIAISLDSLATLYCIIGKSAQALPLYQRALAIREKALGDVHPYTLYSLVQLASFYRNQGRYEQALLLYQRALTFSEQVQGPEDFKTMKLRATYTDLLDQMKIEEMSNE